MSTESSLTKYELQYEHIKDPLHFQTLRVLKKLRELRKRPKAERKRGR